MAATDNELREMLGRAIGQVRAINAALAAESLTYEELHELDRQIPLVQRAARLAKGAMSVATIDDLGGWDLSPEGGDDA